MIGRLDPANKNVTIIGAGIAGLFCAYRLLKAGYQVKILEKSDRSGGLISTLKTAHGPAELAAHSIRSSPEILKVFEELDIPYVQSKTVKKYIFRDGKLRSNPFKIGELLATACFAYFKKSDGSAKTLSDWARQHLGAAAIDNMFVPLSNGIYAASPEELDQQLAFPRFTIPSGQTLFQKIFKAGRAKEKSFVMAPRNGMSDLVKKLTHYITSHDNGLILYNQTITTLPQDGNIIIATSSDMAGQLIGSEELQTIHYAPMVTATVFVKKGDIGKLDGIGTLMARGEDQEILGILFNSSTFDHRVNDNDLVSLTVMLGGTKNPHAVLRGDAELEAVIISELRRIVGFKGSWWSTHLTRWKNAIPVYSAALRETLESMNKGWCATPGHILAGNYAGEVSIRGMCQSSLALIDQ